MSAAAAQRTSPRRGRDALARVRPRTGSRHVRGDGRPGAGAGCCERSSSPSRSRRRSSRRTTLDVCTGPSKSSPSATARSSSASADASSTCAARMRFHALSTLTGRTLGATAHAHQDCFRQLDLCPRRALHPGVESWATTKVPPRRANVRGRGSKSRSSWRAGHPTQRAAVSLSSSRLSEPLTQEADT
jgi:hypothetical protein